MLVAFEKNRWILRYHDDCCASPTTTQANLLQLTACVASNASNIVTHHAILALFQPKYALKLSISPPFGDRDDMMFNIGQRVISFYFRDESSMVARLRGHDRFFLSCTEHALIKLVSSYSLYPIHFRSHFQAYLKSV
ncbi:hypothetical protein Lmor_1958 [Legionella moravica]|uniref:Uncharacterized protein n=1 Tax=Legionella moravica TaxID=39962 RepID=A0A378K007_9GAMM|nr:hypothetical protein Lmor_1958 [Legionella moravica]STX62579.1 Uncharacterised protein [Legionella moravica]